MTPSTPKHEIRQHPGRISAYVLYGLVAVTVLVFCAFFTVGYDIPYEDDASFNAPLLTDTVLMLMYMLILATAVLTIYAIIRGIRHRSRLSGTANNIPEVKITRIIICMIVVCMITTFLSGSDKPMTVNGAEYTDKFWLRTTDMLINTTSILIVAAVCIVSLSQSGYMRRRKRRPEVRR